MLITDFTNWTDEELAQQQAILGHEIDRRRQVEQIPIQMTQMARQYLETMGIHEGQEWRQPEGAHDAYPPGWKVLHNGKAWESLTPGNVWEPGISGWREVLPEAPPEGEPVTYPDFLQPTGAHDAYKIGDRVTFEGQAYESVIDGNVWSPTGYPAGWTAL